jgi:uncharacterized phiE125 gp8 family phage protein
MIQTLAPVRIVAPTEMPISLDDAKQHLRVDHSDDDTLIESLIAAATERLDGWTGILGRALVEQTWRVDIDRPASAGLICFPLAPVMSIGSFDYDDAGSSTVLPPDLYELKVDMRGAFVARAPSASWPSLGSRASITFTAGYGAAAAVPAPLKVAIKMMVADLYEFRQSAIQSTVNAVPVSTTVKALIDPYRRVGF